MLADKVVFVAGASSGMGRAVAIEAAAAGAKVLLFARREAELAAVARAVSDAGGVAAGAAGDATDPEAVQAAVDLAVEKFGRVDVLVNCVGTNIRERSLPELSTQRWRHLLAINLDTAFVLTQAVLPIFRRQQDGLLVHVSSSAAKKPDQSGAGYQASKAGVAALAHAVTEEERGNGIRATVIYPGFTDTALVAQRPTPPTPEMLAHALQPEDVAQLCLAVLALPARAHVTELSVYPSRM